METNLDRRYCASLHLPTPRKEKEKGAEENKENRGSEAGGMSRKLGPRPGARRGYYQTETRDGWLENKKRKIIKCPVQGKEATENGR